MDGLAAHPVETMSAAERASLVALLGVVGRLEDILDTETTALKAHRTIDVAAVSHRKRQGLLELSRLVPHFSQSMMKEAARARLLQLSEKLERNKVALDVQLQAVKEVAEIIAGLIREAESDGTYSAFENRR